VHLGAGEESGEREHGGIIADLGRGRLGVGRDVAQRLEYLSVNAWNSGCKASHAFFAPIGGGCRRFIGRVVADS
jgi:hypothetical protein